MASGVRLILFVLIFVSGQGIASEAAADSKATIKKIVVKYNQSLLDSKKQGPIAVFTVLKEYLDEHQAKEFYRNFSARGTVAPVVYDDKKDQFTKGKVQLQVVSYTPYFYLAGPGGEQAFWKGQSLFDSKKKFDIILNGNLEEIEHVPSSQKNASFWNPLLEDFNLIKISHASATAGDPWFALFSAIATALGATQPSPTTNSYLPEYMPTFGHAATSTGGRPTAGSGNANGLGGSTTISCPVPNAATSWNEQVSTSYINGCCTNWLKSEKKVELVSRAAAGMAPPVPTALPIKSPKRIVIHETESKTDSPVSSIQNLHRNQGWSDVGYNYIIGKDPQSKEWKIYAGRVAPGNEVGLPLVGSHAKGVNSDSIGIAFMGDYRRGEIPDREAVALMGQLVGNLKSEYPSIAEVNSHGLEGDGAEAAIPGHTDCPGKGCLHIVSELNKCIQNQNNFEL